MKLLTSYEVFEPEDKIVEAVTLPTGEETQKIILKGVIQKADTLNQNGRVYPKEIIEREIRNYQKFITEDRAFGELDHPAESVVSFKNVSHVMREAYMEGNVVKGSLEVLNTPCGKIVQELVKAGTKIGISSRGVGTTEQRDGITVVTDWTLVAFDIVCDPSTPGAFMFAEGRNLTKREQEDLQKFINRSDRISRLCHDILQLKHGKQNA